MAKRHSVALRTFAKKHNLKLSWITMKAYDFKHVQVSAIQLGGGGSEGISLFDPRTLPEGAEPKDRVRYVKRMEKRNLLQLVINQDFIEEVLEPLGFYSYDEDGTISADGSKWERILEHLGFEQNGEGDLDEIYLFPADSQLAVDMIFLLGQLGSAGIDPDSDKENFVEMSGGRAIYNPVELDG